KNPNTCKLIGLRKSYSVYKWRYRYWIFFHFFILIMAAISDLWRDCGGHSDTGGQLTWGH
ncbi:unnamed protein product, partial [Staurois parvus]